MTPQQATLKPCPFCGMIDPHKPDCYFELKAAEAPYDQEIAAWNRRAPAPTEPAVDREQIITLVRNWFCCSQSLDELEAAIRATPASPAVPADPVCETGRPGSRIWKWFRTVPQGTLLYAASSAVPAPAPLAPIPDVLFDGMAVYQEITRKLGKSHCHPHQTVSATLDAVVRLLRASQPTSTPEAVNLLVEEAKRVMGQDGGAEGGDGEHFYTFTKPQGWINFQNPGQSWEDWTKAQGTPTTRGWKVLGAAPQPQEQSK